MRLLVSDWPVRGQVGSESDSEGGSAVMVAAWLVVIFCVLVAETGLLIGLFLPGDALLFSAGVLAAAHGSVHLPLPAVLVVGAAGAVVGAQIGYRIGRSVATRPLTAAQRAVVRRGTDRCAAVSERYGPAQMIVVSTCIPVVRTVMNPLVGMIAVPAAVFIRWQVVGRVVWALAVTCAGFWMGSQIPGTDQHLLLIIAVAVLLSVIPVGVLLRQMRGAGDPRSEGANRRGEDASA